jgi:hypothetical protein
VEHAYNSSTHEFEASLDYAAKPCPKKKNLKREKKTIPPPNFLHIYKYRTLKPGEVVLRRGMGKKGNG